MRSFFASSLAKIASLGVILLASLTPAFAQGFNPAGGPPWVYADNYGRWSFQGQAPDTYTFTPINLYAGCTATQLNFQNKPTFLVFSDTVGFAPVFIQDVNGANSEVVTPTSVFTPTSTTCGAVLSPANPHTTFNLQSGTGGLEETLNALGTSGFYTVVLSPEWYKLVSGISSVNAALTNSVTPADIITNATCDASAGLVDVTANPWAFFSCNPSTNKFVVQSAVSKASVAAGAGAGTGPTIALVAGSTTTSGTITLTTGSTPTASAAIFTATFIAPNSGGWAYAPACTVTSVGTKTPVAAVTSTTAGSGGTASTLVLTASATALTASVSGYKWTYVCH